MPITMSLSCCCFDDVIGKFFLAPQTFVVSAVKNNDVDEVSGDRRREDNDVEKGDALFTTLLRN
jgi:hypothetical protein